MSKEFSKKISTVKPSAIREILKMTADPNIISFAAGNPAPEAFPIDTIKKIIDDIFIQDPIGTLQYSVSEGYPPLRNEIASMIDKRNNIKSTYENILVTSGAQQGIEMICKTLCDEGDTVLCENPSFVGALNAFRSYNVNLVGVNCESDGICIDNLEKQIKNNKNIKFLYIIPNFQNPTGNTMSLEKRKCVYNICKKNNIYILEDNPYGDLRFLGEDVPAIKTLDDDNIVLYVGSFSKILSPGLRVGFVVAHKEFIDKLTIAKQCSDVHTSLLSQKICYKFMTEYNLDEHINMLQKIYKNKYSLMKNEIDKHFSKNISVTSPQGGLFLWGKLPQSVNSFDFCKKSVSECGVAIVPGNAFLSDTNKSSNCFRLNYSTPSDKKIITGIGKLGKLTKKMFD